jgi:hypothetical protein
MTTLTPKTNSLTLLICLVSFLIITVAGCKKEDKNATKTTPPAITGPYLYVGGGLVAKGIYWKTSLSQTTANAVPDTIKNSKATYITAIVTSGSDVYIATAGQTGGYFKNNALVTVTGASSVNHLTLSGADVYTSGFDIQSNLAYWKNNTETNLENTIGKNLFPFYGDAGYGISGIAVSGSNALLSGNLFIQNEPFSPDTAREGNFGLLWTNNNVKLFGPGYLVSADDELTAVGVAVSGSDVYVAGRMPDKTLAGGYWKNGTWNAINNGAFIASGITASGTDVYIAGYTYVRTSSSLTQQGVYWKNGTIINIPNSSASKAIAVNGKDVYVLGTDNSGNNVVWKNGGLFETLGSATTQYATSIAIGN